MNAGGGPRVARRGPERQPAAEIMSGRLWALAGYYCLTVPFADRYVSQLVNPTQELALAHSHVCLSNTVWGSAAATTNKTVTLIKHGNCSSPSRPVPLLFNLFINVAFNSGACHHWRANWLHLDHLPLVVLLPRRSLNCSVLDGGMLGWAVGGVHPLLQRSAANVSSSSAINHTLGEPSDKVSVCARGQEWLDVNVGR